MEEAWKQSSVALGFQGVLISICSSETRGIKRRREDKKKLFAGEDHIPRYLALFLCVFLIRPSRRRLLSLTQSSGWFHIIYNYCMDSERSTKPVSQCLLTKSLVIIAGSYPFVCYCSGTHNETKEASVTLLQWLSLQVAALHSEKRAMKNNVRQ